MRGDGLFSGCVGTRLPLAQNHIAGGDTIDAVAPLACISLGGKAAVELVEAVNKSGIVLG